MQNNSLFYKYYDLLYSEKMYKEETDFLFETAGKLISNPVNKILEVGCGTGNHTLEIARKNIPVVALDIDANMIAIAELKKQKHNAGNIEFVTSKIENLKQKDFDLAIAMFNVITYVNNTKDLISFFKGIRERLNEGGVFIFDCWNGVAALLDPPSNKQIARSHENEEIVCDIVSETDYLYQKTTLTYLLNVKNLKSGKDFTDKFSFNQTLWTPMQIEHCIEEGGLEKLSCIKPMHFDVPAKKEDWKIMYICKKKYKLE